MFFIYFFVLKSSRPSLALKKAPPLTPALSPQERGRKPPLVLYLPHLSLPSGRVLTLYPSPTIGIRDVTALRCSEPLRNKVGGPSKVFAVFCGMGPPGDNDTICLSLMHIYTSLRKTKTSNKYIVISSLTLLQNQRNLQHS